MKAPLPEVPLVPPPVEDKEPPLLLIVFIWSGVILNLDLWVSTLRSRDFVENLIFFAVFGTYAWVLWNLWRGRSWARYVTLLFCVFNLVRDVPYSQLGMSTQNTLDLIGVVRNLLLFIYLWTPAMRRYFSRHEPLAQ
jgi:hypothetical protein